jgi:hypothetical protein
VSAVEAEAKAQQAIRLNNAAEDLLTLLDEAQGLLDEASALTTESLLLTAQAYYDLCRRRHR